MTDSENNIIDIQPEHGFRRIENRLFKALLQSNLNGSEFAVFLSILDFVWGWGTKEKIISTKQISEATNLGIRTVSRAIMTLKNKNLIFVKPSGIKIQGGGELQEFSINKQFNTWNVNPETELLSQKCPNNEEKLDKNVLITSQKCPNNESKLAYILIKKYKENKEKNNKYDFAELLLKRWNLIKGVGKNNMTSSLQKLILKVLDSCSEEDLYSAVEAYSAIINDPEFFYDYKFISTNSENHGLKGFLNSGVKAPNRGYNKFLPSSEPYSILKVKKTPYNASYFDEVRLNHKFYTVNSYDPKSPLDKKSNKYMGIPTNKLEHYNIHSTIQYEILEKIENNIFKPEYYCKFNKCMVKEGVSRFVWLEESMIYLIRWKEEKRVFKDRNNEELLKELVEYHNKFKKDFGY